jgi:predicted DNA-binding protein
MPVQVRLPSEQVSRLEFMSQQTGHTTDYYIVQAIDMYLEDIQTAEAIARKIHSGEEKTYTAAEVRAELGL